MLVFEPPAEFAVVAETVSCREGVGAVVPRHESPFLIKPLSRAGHRSVALDSQCQAKDDQSENADTVACFSFLGAEL